MAFPVHRVNGDSFTPWKMVIYTGSKNLPVRRPLFFTRPSLFCASQRNVDFLGPCQSTKLIKVGVVEHERDFSCHGDKFFFAKPLP